MKVFFRKIGNGQPLIILHGLYGSSDNWISIAKLLSDKYTIFLIDQRNHGHSDFSNSHTYDDMCDDLSDFFKEQQIAKATVLGHSMGGKTAMWFAAKYPKKIEKLIIADIAPKNYLQIGNKSQIYFHRTILQAMKNVDFSTVNSRKDVDAKLTESIKDKKIRQFLLKNVATNKEPREYQWRLNVNVLDKYLDEIIGGVDHKLLEKFAPITNYPVTFIRGLLSDYISDNDIIDIKQIYPKAQFIDIPNAGHWLHAEQPELFVESITKEPV